MLCTAVSWFTLYMLRAYIWFQAVSATLIVNTAVILTAGTAVVSPVAVAAAIIVVITAVIIAPAAVTVVITAAIAGEEW